MSIASRSGPAVFSNSYRRGTTSHQRQNVTVITRTRLFAPRFLIFFSNYSRLPLLFSFLYIKLSYPCFHERLSQRWSPSRRTIAFPRRDLSRGSQAYQKVGLPRSRSVYPGLSVPVNAKWELMIEAVLTLLLFLSCIFRRK